MADDPKLVVALEARLDRFEKQMREAGLIAEREMRKIEDRTSQITIGTTLGNIISKGIEKAISGAIDAIKEAIDLMKQLGATASRTALSFEDIQRIGFAAALKGIDQVDTLKGINSIATKMDEMNRKETELSKLLEANNIKYKDRNGLVVDANKGLELAAQLMAKAGTPIEKGEIARVFGLTEQWVGVLGQGVEALRKMKAGANIDPELEKNVRATEALFKIMYSITGEFQNWGHAISNYVLGPLAATIGLIAQVAQHAAEVNKGGLIGEATEAAAKRWTAIAKTAREAVEDANRTRLTVTAPQKSGVTWPQDPKDKNELARANEQLSKRIALTQAELDMVGKGVALQTEARELALLTEAAKRAGLNVDTAITEQMREQAAEAGKLQLELVQRTARWNEMLSMSKELGSTLSDAMKDLVLNGKKFDEVLKNIANRIASKAFDKLFDIVFAPTAGGTGSLFTQLLGFKKMAGGPVGAGRPYMVGERGPELFVPNASGRIVPNTALGGGRGGGIVIEGSRTAVQIEGSADRETIALMQQMFAARDRRFVADVAGASRELRRRSVRV